MDTNTELNYLALKEYWQPDNVLDAQIVASAVSAAVNDWNNYNKSAPIFSVTRVLNECVATVTYVNKQWIIFIDGNPYKESKNGHRD